MYRQVQESKVHFRTDNIPGNFLFLLSYLYNIIFCTSRVYSRERVQTQCRHKVKFW